MRFRRLAALLGALTLFAVGCEQVSEDVTQPLEDVASEVRSAVEDAATEGQDGADAGGTTTGGDATDGGQGGDSGGGLGGDAGGDSAGGSGGDSGGDSTGSSGGDGGEQVRTNDLGGVGANGRAMLRSSHPTMVVEIDVQEGIDPDPSALDHLLGVLGSVAAKPSGIVQAGGNRFASDRTTWSSGDLRAVAEQHRANYSDSQTVAVYVLYVRGGFEKEGAIGVAHNASEFAVFPEKWRGTLSQTLGSATAVERSVLVHEAGHLFGLINLTYESRFDREDPERPGHSDEKDSVMYWAIESTAIGQVFSGPPPDDFNDKDRADLKFLRTGSY